MKKKQRKHKKISIQTSNKHLRSGSKTVKQMLMEKCPYCDICGGTTKLQLHHVFLVRHGFSTKLEWRVLLCANCHRAFHKRWDEYLDITFNENPNIDFLKIYNVLRKL